MYNNNTTTMELYLTGNPERSQRADVVKCNSAVFQGKKEDGKTPMWVQIEAWKFQAKCLEGCRKGQTLVVTGSLKMDYWGNDNEKSQVCLNADSIAVKAWPDDNQQSSQQNTGNNYDPNAQPSKPQHGPDAGNPSDCDLDDIPF